MKVTVLGAGNMGSAMALRLAEMEHEVTAWNRSPEPLEPLAGEGIAVTEDLTDAVSDAAVVITMLTDGDAVRSVAEQMLPALSGDAVWVQASTVGAAWADRLRVLADEHDRLMLDAPVSGSTGPARSGSLTWLVAGSGTALDLAHPVLDSLGERVLLVGESQEASRLKLVVNAWMSAATVAMADALRATDALGVARQSLIEVLTDGPLGMPYALQKAQLMNKQEYPAGFPVALALKDIRLLQQADRTTPLLDVVEDRLRAASEAGRDRDDLAAVASVD
ncbi:NAD(P)-dependent oxidoreductase [Nocardioides sp. BP30]|uniref:NAD(P)-dependent oxidoreductase n=1 Tax=Nocardioides sp. BP30 TaxID=3036374 RepID=UPI002468C32C|nr:NAD(P)-dependent oxidoreductase [Nocardioides sp. BP30]WGL50600.1 NAD(P)-dependent oxidoreductase [Nocardioides sp. BP30]